MGERHAIKAQPMSWFTGLASILRNVEFICWWPQGLVDANSAMIFQSEGDATRLVSARLVSCKLCTGCGLH